MNIKQGLAISIYENLDGEIKAVFSLEDLENTLEIPKNKDMGDYALPCFRLAKALKKAPPQIAESLKNTVRADEIEQLTVAGPYLNIKLRPEFYSKILFDELRSASSYGSSDMGSGKTVLVEFCSANIAKPFHIGHLRSTMIGNALYRIYKYLGYNTIAINHLGDYGTQFGKLIYAYRKWGDKAAIEKAPIDEFLKLYVKFHEEAEKYPEINDEARAYFTKLEHGEPDIKAEWEWIREKSLNEFMKTYDKLGVTFDSYNGEAFYSDKMAEVLEILRNKGLVQKSEGAEIVDLSEDNMPNVLITKKDGSTLYITRDIAAAIYRMREYKFYKNIYVVAYEQDLHFKQLFKILEKMGFEDAKNCVHVNFGMISLEDGNLSTRKGRVVTMEEVLERAKDMALSIINEKNPNIEDKDKLAEAIGYGAIIFQDLYNQRVKDYTFSWDKALSLEGESAPYVQYVHARACTLIEKSGIEPSYDVDYKLLSDAASQELIKTLLGFPAVIELACDANEPSKISRYAVELAGSFNHFYNENQINVEDEELKKARISLVYATKTVIKQALYLIGVAAPDKM